MTTRRYSKQIRVPAQSRTNELPITSRMDLLDGDSKMLETTPRTGACFSKVPKRLGPISGATIAFIPSQRRGSKHSNFAILLIFLILKTCKMITFSKWADCSLTTSFSGPKSSRDFRETGPWTESRTYDLPVLIYLLGKPRNKDLCTQTNKMLIGDNKTSTSART